MCSCVFFVLEIAAQVIYVIERHPCQKSRSQSEKSLFKKRKEKEPPTHSFIWCNHLKTETSYVTEAEGEGGSKAELGGALFRK